MPSKKHSKKSTYRSHKNPRSQKTDQNVLLQRAALIVLGLAVVAVIWLVINVQRQNQNAGQTSSAAKSLQYDAPPRMTIDVAKKYFATVKMANGGEFIIELYPQKAPITVNSFVFLARQGFYDGVTFHRVLEGFMAQSGDPTGTGGGGPGYQFVNEYSDLTFDKVGVMAMANAGKDTNGSQFFITFAPVERLNGGYTIFGQVISGMDVVEGIRLRDPDQNPDYPGDAIESVTISEE